MHLLKQYNIDFFMFEYNFCTFYFKIFFLLYKTVPWLIYFVKGKFSVKLYDPPTLCRKTAFAGLRNY